MPITDLLLNDLKTTFDSTSYDAKLGSKNAEHVKQSQNDASGDAALPDVQTLRGGVTEALLEIGMRYPKGFSEASYTKATIGEMDCFVYRAENSAECPTLVMFYGGGFCLNTMNPHKAFMAHIASKTSCNIILPDYPLAPEDKAPEITKKGEAFLLGLLTQSTELGFSDRINLMGWSSGGNMAMTLSLNILKTNPALYKAKVKELFLFSPWLDLSLTVSRNGPFQIQQALDITAAGPDLLEMMARCYLPDGMRGDEPEYCPTCRSHDELKELPPVTVITGGCEVLFGDAILAAHVMKKAGVKTELVVIEGQTHNYMVFDTVTRDGVFAPSLVANMISDKPIDEMTGDDGLGLDVSRFNCQQYV